MSAAPSPSRAPGPCSCLGPIFSALALVAVFCGSALMGTRMGQAARQGPEKPPPDRGRVVEHGRGHRDTQQGKLLRRLALKRYGSMVRRAMKAITPPPAWDSREKGWIPPIKDQGQCGSCWDFSGTGMVEIAYRVAGWGSADKPLIFSEQYTLDCGNNGGCNGDDNTNVLQWAQQTGLPLTADYGPYQARSGSCRYQDQMQLHKITNWGLCDPGNDQGMAPAAAIKAAIMQYGAVGSAVAAGSAWDGYHGGVQHDSGNRGINHDVILVGWDDSKSTRQGKTVWLMRNSWSPSWGERGYMWMDENCDGIGWEAAWCAAPAAPGPIPPPPPGPGPIPPPPPGPGPIPPPPPGPEPETGFSGTINIRGGHIIGVTPVQR